MPRLPACAGTEAGGVVCCSGCGHGWPHVPDQSDMHGLDRASRVGLTAEEGRAATAAGTAGRTCRTSQTCTGWVAPVAQAVIWGGGAAARERALSAIVRVCSGISALHSLISSVVESGCAGARLHDRMPVVLRTPEDQRLWLEDRELSHKCACRLPLHHNPSSSSSTSASMQMAKIKTLKVTHCIASSGLFCRVHTNC